MNNLRRKIILADWGHFTMTSIFNKNGLLARKNKLLQEGKTIEADKMFIMPATYTAMTMLIGNLKKIGVNAELDDRVIIACDGRGNWRKEYTKEYKANRPEQRKQAFYINWDKEFAQHNKLKDKLVNNSPFFVIEIPTLEADDIVAQAVRYYKDYECIILGQDHDYDQLLSLDNVKIFSPHPKVKLHPYRILDLNRDKEREKAFASLHKKIKKETADNLISPVETEKDYEIRNMVVNLLELPEFVTQKIKVALDKIDGVLKMDFDITSFSQGIQKRFYDIYGINKIISYESCFQFLSRKKVKKEKVNKVEV